MLLLLTALGLVFVIEGLFYALFPGQLRIMLVLVAQMSRESLRLWGAVLLGVGVIWIYVVQLIFTGAS